MRHLCFYLFVLFSTGWRKRVLRNLFVSWSLVFNFVSHPKKSQRKRDRVYPGWKNRNRLPVFFLVLVVDNEHLRQPVETAFSFPGVPISKAAFSGCLFPIWGKTGKRKIPKRQILCPPDAGGASSSKARSWNGGRTWLHEWRWSCRYPLFSQGNRRIVWFISSLLCRQKMVCLIDI